MSSLDRIKKKREQLLVENNKSYSSTDKSMQRISSLRNELSTTGKIDYGDIAPIKLDNSSTKEKDKKDTWFNSGAFGDDKGNWFTDALLSVGSTVADVGVGVVKGIGNMAEGIVDLGTYAVGGVADVFGADEFADKTKKFAQKSYMDKWVDPLDEKASKNSLLGEKSDAISEGLGYVAGMLLTGGVGGTVGAAIGGTTKAAQLGATLATTGTTFASSMGSGIGQAYTTMDKQVDDLKMQMYSVSDPQEKAKIQKQIDAIETDADGNAVKYGIISGIAEAGTELIFGGLGKTIKAVGLSHGLSQADDILAKSLTKKIENQVIKNFAEFGIKAGAEGTEEVLSGVIQAFGQKATYMSEEELGQLLEDQNLLESFVTGAIVSGIAQAPSLSKANTSGRDFVTNYTQNEQSVIDKEVENRIAEQEKDGKKLNKKQINEITKQVQNELEKGYISTDTIESVLGGDTYNNLKSTRDNKTKIENEIKELEGKKNAEITVKEMEHLKDLREQLKGIDTNTLETDLQGKMGQIIKSDGYLQRSYQEKAKRGQKFTYDASKVTNEFEKAALESASKVMNDTNRSHEFVEPIIKLAKDKGTYYEFTNNKELEKSNYDVKGRQVNGLVTVEKDGKKKILINVDSSKALNTIVGHETTHLLEGTQEYQELQDAIFNYAKTKGDFDSRQASLYSLYKDIKGADVNSELTADLVGDYLFTDNNFISELSTQKPTVFQKIKELIDDLVVRFKGTKEEKALREVQKKFKEAYRQQSGQQTGQQSATKTDTQYSLTDNQGRTLTKEQQEYFKDSKVRDENGDLEVVYHSTPNQFTVFDNSMSGENTGYENTGFGTFVTTNRAFSERFKDIDGTGKQGYTMELFANVTKPITHPYKAGIKYGDEQASKIVEDYYKAIGETEALDEMQEMIEYEEADSLYDAYMNIVQMDSSGIYETANDERMRLEDAGYDAVEIIEGYESELVEGSTSDEVVSSYAIFNSNQLKNIDNTNPTTDADIRYSLSEKGLKEIADEFGGGKNYWEANLYDKDLYGATYFLKHQDSVKKKFKELNNINIEPVYKDIELKGIGTKDENVQNFIKDNNLNVVDLANNQELLDKFYKLEHEAIKKQFNIDDAEADEIFSQWKDYFEKQKGVNETIWPLLRFKKDFRNIIEGNTKEIDNIETAKLERQLVDDSPEFERFVTKYAEKLFGEKVEYDADDVMEEAKFNHGTTDNFEVGAYMTTDGSLLNFNYGGYRDDHRTLSVYDLNMKEFMDYGAIRMQPETPGFEMQVEPTNEQYDKLYDYIDYIKSTRKSDDAISIDIDKGNSYDSATYTMNTPTSKIINDVKTYWKTGQFPKQSEFAQFRYSLSKENEISPRNPNLTYGEDVKLQVEETIAPLQEEIQTLTETVQELKEQIAPVRDEYAPLTEEDLPYLEQQYNEAPKEDIAPPETEENIPVAEDEITPTKSLFETRNYEEVGNRKVNAYQYDNPEVKPYFQEAARSMIDDLANSLKGQRIYNDQLYYDSNGEQGFFGINRFTSNDIAELLDGVDGKYKLSYKDLEKGLKAIIEDKGAENNAASKRIEFYLDKRLREGFTTLDGVEIPANQEYLDLLETKEMNDYYSNIPIGEAPVENVGNPVGNVSNTKVSEDIAPIKVQIKEDSVVEENPSKTEQQPIEENKNLSVKESNELKRKNLERSLQKYKQDSEQSLKTYNDLIEEMEKKYDSDSKKTINAYDKFIEATKKDYVKQIVEPYDASINEKRTKYNSLKKKNTQKASNLLQQIANLEAQKEKVLNQSKEKRDNEINKLTAQRKKALNQYKKKRDNEINRLTTQRNNIQVEYERKMNNIQKRIDKMNSKEFKTAEQRITKQQEYRQQARELIGDTSTWKDKKMGISYQIHTFKRNLRDIVRGANGRADLLKADAIYEEYEGKYDKNEAKLKVEYNRIIEPYAKLNLNEQEHVFAQMLGEKRHNPDTTLTQEKVMDYYSKYKSKIDMNKVNNAIESARKTYDELFNRINERLKEQGMKELEYRRGYFPHFIEEKQGLLAKIFDWKIHKDDIPTDIAGLTELNNPERSWQTFNKHRESDITDYNFGKGLETYVRGALDWIYHIEDIQKRRALENEIRYQHSEKGIQEQIEAIYSDTELDTDQIQERIDAIYKTAQTPLNNFVTDFRNATNRLANKKSTLDRSLEYATNRRIYSTMTNLSNRVSGNMIGGSISSALTNFIPITQSWGEVSPLSSLKAARETIKNAAIDDGTIAKSTFLTNRLVKNENLYKTGWDKVQDKIAIMTDVIDSFTSQTVWRSKYNENVANGMSEMEAIANADNFAKNVIAGRSRGNEPTIFHSKNPITKMFTAFQVEVANQYDYMFKDMPKDVEYQSKAKLIKGYATMFVGAYLYNALYSSLVGRDVAFDPIGIVEDILKELGFGDDEEEEKTASEKFTAITEDLVQQLPFVGGLFGGGRMPISAAIPYENPIEMVKGTSTDLLDALNEEKRDRALKDLTTEWLKPVTYLALPVGGGQINKTIQGLSMYDDDLPVAGSYTNSGDLRFTADTSPSGVLKSALFGRWASDSAQEYVDSGFKTIKKSNIDEMVDLDMSSTEYRKYRNGLNKAGTKNEDKINYINSLDVSDEHKNIMANNVLKRDYDVDMSDYGEMSGYDEFDYSYKNPEKYKLITQIDTFDNYNSYKDDIADIKEQFSEDNGYSTKDRKAAVQQYINSLSLDIPQKIMLEKMAGGYSIKDYENYMFSYIQSLPMTAEEKQAIHKQLFD